MRRSVRWVVIFGLWCMAGSAMADSFLLFSRGKFGAAAPCSPSFLLLEAGAGFLLQEDGSSKFKLEDCP